MGPDFAPAMPRYRQITPDSLESGRFGWDGYDKGEGANVTDDRVVTLRPGNTVASPQASGTRSDAPEDLPSRLTMGVEVPADRRAVLMVQTIAQLATLAQEAGVPLDDGLAEGAERLARNLRGAGLALPVHLEEALEEISLALSPPPEPAERGGTVVPFRGAPTARRESEE